MNPTTANYDEPWKEALSHLENGFLDFKKNKLDLKFEGLNFSKFIDKNNLSINIDQLIISIKNYSQKLSLDEQ